MTVLYRLLILPIILCLSFSVFGDDSHLLKGKFSYDLAWFEDMDFDIEDDGTLVFTSTFDEDEYVAITEDARLFISGEEIYLDRRQERLVGRFYDKTLEMIDLAKDVGKMGAKIGIRAAKIGVKAVAGAFKAILSEDEMDEFEEKIERESEEIERQAEKLEDLADELEDVADDLTDLHDDLIDEIDELDRLRWF